MPETEAREVLDFLEFLKAKRARRESGEAPPDVGEKTVTLEEHHALVEHMRAITAAQPMTRTTVEDMRREARY